MVWYFNFCSYFLPNDPVFNNNRMILFVIMGVQALFYGIMRIFIIKYQGQEAFKERLKTKTKQNNLEDNNDKLSGDVDQKQQKTKSDNQSTDKQKTDQNKSSDQNDSAVHIIRDENMNRSGYPFKKMGKFEQMFTTIDFLNFQRTFADYFGHHAVGIAMCSIFCPMYFVTLASLVYLLLGIICFFFHGFKFEKTALAFYIITMIINVCMFFTALVNVGLLNYDSENHVCYATEDFSKYLSR